MTDISTSSKASSPPAAIAKAIIAVMKAVTGVGKTGHNKFHNYDYSSKEDVLKVLQPAMVDAGLAIIPSVEGWELDKFDNFVVQFRMTLLHETGESWTTYWHGVAQDKDGKGRNGDKWLNKAATAAEKYFLLKLFHIPVAEDDPDADANNASAGQNKSAPPKKAPITQAQKATPPPKTDAAKFAQWWAKGSYSIPRTDKDGVIQDAMTWSGRITQCMESAPGAVQLKAFWQANKADLEALEDEDTSLFNTLLHGRDAMLNTLESKDAA